MKNTLIFLLFSFLLIVQNACIAVSPGEQAPAISVAKWVSGNPVSLPSPGDGISKPEHERDYYVVMIWGTWAPGSAEAFRLLKHMSGKYPKLYVMSVARGNEKGINDFLLKNSIADMNVALDKRSRTTKTYMKNSVMMPKVFLVNDERIIMWSGEPVDFPDVYKSVVSGKFDLSKAEKIDKIKIKLVNALQTTQLSGVVRYSDKILDIDPENAFALRSRLFVFENKNQLVKAVKYVAELIDKAPKYSRLYFIKFDLMLRSGIGRKKLNTGFKEVVKKFSDNSAVMLELVWFMINRVPFAKLDPALMVDTAEKAVDKMPAEITSQEKAAYKAAMGRVMALCGNFKRSAKFQKEAVELLKGTKLGKDAVETLAVINAFASEHEKMK